MSDLYVDPFYWEFGYAVGDIDLQALEADPVVTSTTATGALGYVRSLSANLDAGAAALANNFELNTTAPLAFPGQAPTATVSGSAEVIRFVFVSGGFSVAASCTAALDITVNAAAAIQATAAADAELDLQVLMHADIETTAGTEGVLDVAVNLHAGISAAAAATATLAIAKPLVADADSAVHTSAVALLGKRLAGGVSVSAAVSAAAAIQKAMTSSIGALAVTSATAQVGKPIRASASCAGSTSAVAAVGKPIVGGVTATAALAGRTVLLRFVPVEIADQSSVDVLYSLIYADAELVDGVLESTQANVFAEVSDPNVSMAVSYTEIYADAELVDAPELEVTW